MTGDPRQADVDEAQALLDQVERDDAVRLPAVSSAELGALGALQGALVDDDAWSWWIGMPEADRLALAAMALKFLVHRGLVDPPGPDDESAGSPGDVALRVRPLLAMVLAGRLQPAFVAVRRDGDGSAPDRMRLYGIAERSDGESAERSDRKAGEQSDGEGGRLRAVLAEEATGKHASRFGPGYQYALVSPAEAARSLVRWAGRPSGRRLIGRRHAKVIDVYRPNTGSGPSLVRLTVSPTADGFRVERDDGDSGDAGAGGPAEYDGDLLGRVLADLLTGRTP